MSDAPLSPRNPRVTAARRLVRAKGRAEAGEFLAEGPQAVREALALGSGLDGGPVVSVYVAAGSREPHAELMAAASKAGVPVSVLTDDVAAQLSETVSPQGIVAVCRRVDVPLAGLLGQAPRLVAVLAAVRDPGNAGTVLRTADAAGAGGVVLTSESVDVYNGKCVRATAGSLFHLPVSIGAPVTEVVAEARAAGLRVLAADGAGAADLDDEIDSGRLALPTAWVFGNEAWGLPEDVRAMCDSVVRIPIHGRAESLNLASAAAVCLYASARAHR